MARKGQLRLHGALLLALVMSVDVTRVVGQLEPNEDEDGTPATDMTIIEQVSSDELLDAPLSSSSGPTRVLDSGGTNKASYSGRMAVSGGLSGYSGMGSSSLQSGMSENQKDASVGAGVSSVGLVGGALLGTAAAYRHWIRHQKDLEASKTYPITVRLEQINDKEGKATNVALTLDETWAAWDNFSVMKRRIINNFNHKLQSFPRLHGVTIGHASLYRVERENMLDRGWKGEHHFKVASVQDMKPGGEYVLVPDGQTTPKNRQLCVPVPAPCRAGDAQKASCTKIGEVIDFPEEAAAENTLQISVPDRDQWLVHRRIPVRQPPRSKQTISIADPHTNTYCDLVITIPDGVKVRHHRPDTIRVIFFRHDLKDWELERLYPDEGSNAGERERLPYYKVKESEGQYINY